MTPLATTRRFIPPYLAAWVPIAGLLAAMLRLTPGTTWTGALAVAIPGSALLSFLCVAIRYPVRGLPAERMPVSRLLALHLGGAAFATAVWLGALRLWVEVLGQTRPFELLPEAFRSHAPLLAAAGLLLYLLAVTFHSLLRAVERSREAERRALELSLIARDAEIALLRSQVDPHFLFNALNSIAGLTRDDPDRARTLCLRLGDFLRAGLRIGSRARISLREELALARDYLEIERIRFGARLRVAEDVDEAGLSCPVPPLILLPLLENAVRHGISGLVEGGEVLIGVRVGGGGIEIIVENPRDAEARSRAGEGIGLRNVRRRLETLYGRAGGLAIRETPESFRIEIAIPRQLAPESGDGGGASERQG
ncbi:MAG: hypothetical protein FJY88_01045 [Candidatus Eisenbacteria bacterium]|nr:hypothetical protein [Candidatus Eisenbacteria bacterium]